MAGGLRDHFRGLQLMRWVYAHVFVALALAAMSMWPTAAHARGPMPVKCGPAAACTLEEAKAECMAWDPLPWDNWVQIISRRCPNYILGSAGNVGRFYGEYIAKRHNGTTTPWTGDTSSFYWVQDCKKEPTYTGTGPWSSGHTAKNGSMGCRNGCNGVWSSNADSTKTWAAMGSVCPDDEQEQCKLFGDGYYWNSLLKVCEPPEGKCPGGAKPNSLGKCAPEPCPDGMAQQQDGTCKKKENECPAGQIRSPDGKCLPGDGQCAKGEVRGQDGTCKKDADNDGQPDPVTDESFSGGDDCNAPPSCSGSPIMCGQARIQWRIDCNTRKNRNIAGGTCASMPICTGDKCDAMEYSALLMQWRSACALEKMAQGNGNGGGENGDTKAIRDALTGTGGAVTTATDRPSSDVWAPRSGTPVKPDTGGYGWGRTCPQPPSFEVFGSVIQINTAPLCNWLILGSYFVMGLAALASLRIIASKDA
ncbi:virulence factor TspB C-terminal domain-related protein [Stenotrophomonas maltophilia]|uniref:virulence factor TspB C-terminal domain-related protein n=1 Tax=Stenotrophomonas maltophilia TaxID=40324 RepID=UPI002B1D2BC3|nr:virulence factor TspB C-terminal domain-related protein [Stenotrophomonas maltophilia]